MTAVLRGVRILEVAEHTFVPAASALLSDWGAEVIKIEHVERGDAMRGLASTGLALVPSDVHALLEHSNRGKKSLGLDLTAPDGLEILYKLAATADVFLTNKLPTVREKLKIGVEEIREANPDIIYVRGTGQGERGPDADKGSYDSLAFRARSGVAVGAKRPEYDLMPVPPAPGFGDSIGAMTIAGGILGALFHRERTGEATIVDVSLLGVGLWAMGQAVALSLVLGQPWSPPPNDRLSSNPLSRNYTTGDGRVLAFTCLQPGKYWKPLCEAVGRPELAIDARFADHASLMANSTVAIGILDQVFASATLDECASGSARSPASGRSCRTHLRRWPIRRPWPTAMSRSATRPPGRPSSWWPRRSSSTRNPRPTRAPEFNEHGDSILADLGLDSEAIIDLKIRGVVA